MIGFRSFTHWGLRLHSRVSWYLREPVYDTDCFPEFITIAIFRFRITDCSGLGLFGLLLPLYFHCSSTGGNEVWTLGSSCVCIINPVWSSVSSCLLSSHISVFLCVFDTNTAPLATSELSSSPPNFSLYYFEGKPICTSAYVVRKDGLFRKCDKCNKHYTLL
jgi:hypothetical protein